MQHLWAPWRIQYILQEKPQGCIFCEKPGEDDDAANYILYRGRHNYIMLNRYPYNPGHLMVVTRRHLASPELLEHDEGGEHFALVSLSLKVLNKVLSPEGMNIGANLGKVAGAGIADHFHTHVVPRWNGDTNLMTVIADVRAVPEALADTYRRLKPAFDQAGKTTR